VVEECFVGSVGKNLGKRWTLFHRTRLVLCENGLNLAMARPKQCYGDQWADVGVTGENYGG
jgi:hypothetical protein